MLKNITIVGLALLTVLRPGKADAQTLWDRRDFNTVTMFRDYRARNVGDVLTVFIEETTGFDAQEVRNMEKKTNANGSVSANGNTSSLGGVLRAFGMALNVNANSDRKFEGNNTSSIERKFTDRMSFIVVAVMSNGNLVVEGYRQRMITREMRI